MNYFVKKTKIDGKKFGEIKKKPYFCSTLISDGLLRNG
jgi:hypothetical protein